MATKVKWREVVFQDLIAHANALGIGFDEEKINQIIEKNAEREPDDNGFSPKLQKGYVRAAAFTEIGRKRFMNALQEVWPSAKKLKRKNKPEDSIPTHIDPGCKACGGTGVNSEREQCSPCVAHGARIKRRGAKTPKLPEAPAAPTPPSPPKKKGKLPPPPPPPSKKDKEKEGERNRKAVRAHRSTKPPLPPPPPPPKRPGPPPPPQKKPSKVKEKTPRGQPQAPSSVGKTYGPRSDKKPPRLKAPTFFAVCIQVRLDSPYEETVVVDELNRYVVEQTGFGANIQEARQLGPQVFDLRVHYAVHLTEVFDVIEGHAWVQKAQALPVQDLGKGDPVV